jgi:hypothetical protein
MTAARKNDLLSMIRAFSVAELMDRIKGGEIRVPDFQRRLRWRKRQRLELFDSIYRGFPIGSFLFWQHPAEAGRVEIGRFSTDVDASWNVLWVVDGQQRLSTLAEALLAGPPNAGEPVICFDTIEKRFDDRVPGEVGPRWIPLYETARLSSIASPEISELRRRLWEYQVAGYVVEASDTDVPLQIFNRLNSAGMALTSAEVFDALHRSLSSGGSSTLREMATELEALRFGRIEEDLLLQALLAVHRKDPGKSFQEQVTPEDVPSALADTVAAVRQTIVFLRKNAQIPHLRLLPDERALVPLSLFFHEHREPRSRTRQLLARWLWREAASEAPHPRVFLRQAIAAIRPGDEEASVQNLLARTGERPSLWKIPTTLNLSARRVRVVLNAFAALRPLHLEARETIDVAALFEQEDQPGVRILGGGGKRLANYLLHPVVQDLLRQLESCEDERVLRSHLVSREAQRALRQGDPAGFLRMRERDLRAYAERFLDSRAEWEAIDRDRPSLASLVVDDE